MKCVPCECERLTGETRHDCPDCGGEGIRPERRGWIAIVVGARLANEDLEALRDRLDAGELGVGVHRFRGILLHVETMRDGPGPRFELQEP